MLDTSQKSHLLADSALHTSRTDTLSSDLNPGRSFTTTDMLRTFEAEI